jgi:hypothetical protein
MKKNKYSLLFVLLLFLVGACTKDFEEINTDPNLPVAVPLANHLAGAMIDFDRGNMQISDGAVTINTRYVGGRWGNPYNPDVSNTYGNMTSANWGGYYAGLVNFNDIIAKATEAEAYNMVAAALTYRANMTQIATDRWGDMPYSEATQAADDVLRPAYDTQVSIYNEIISDLKTAADYFKAGYTDDIGTVDPFYSGDVAQWQKFCNSLRLRVAIRISNVDEAGATAIISEVLGNPGDYPITASWEDAAEITYGGIGTDYGIGYWYWMNLLEHSGPTLYLIDMLKAYDDPRLERMCSPAPGPLEEGIIEYRGTTEIGRDPAFEIPQMSYFNKNYYLVDNTTGPNIHLRHSEVCLVRAEIYSRGLASGGDAAAQAAYEEGVAASMKEMSIMIDATPQIDDAVIDTYLANATTAWSGTPEEKLEKIWTQKWIAMCFMENEPWAELRRTDVPYFEIARGSYYDGHNSQPWRLPYPSDEELMNSENSAPYFEKQLAGDYLWGGQMWWDTRTGVN